MKGFLRTWKRVPHRLRQIIVLIVGSLVVIASGIIGAIPGPGGTVIFLFGIAILSTEFAWAKELRDYIIDWLRRFARYGKKHPSLGVFISLLTLIVIFICAYAFYSYIN